MTRREDWEKVLSDFLLASEKVEFAWGVHDCCLIAADAVHVMTGSDIAAEFRGRYDSQLSAFRVIREVTGGCTVADAAAYSAAQSNLSEYRYPAFAQRGDLVTLQDGENLIAGIVHLNGRHAITIGKDGLRRYPVTQVTRAWKV